IQVTQAGELHRKKLMKLLNEENVKAFREDFLDLLPYDQAVFFKEQTEQIRLKIYSYLSPREVSEIMKNIELEDTELFITEMDTAFATMVFSEMPYDDAVDILQELERDEVASFLAIMDEETVKEIKTLLRYEEKTAGSIMTTEYVSVFKS